MDLAKNPRIKIMLKIIDSLNLRNKNILDIGCSDGYLLSQITNCANNFYGLEASDYGVAECLKKNIKVQNFFWDDQKALPYEDNFFDLVVAGELIEHIFDTDYFLQEIKRVLKDNGYFLITTPNLASLGRRLYLFFGRNPLMETSLNNSCGHIRYFTFASLKNLLTNNGFKVMTSCSDLVNFSQHGRYKSRLLAKLAPTIGQSIIVGCHKVLKHENTENTKTL